MLTFGLISLIIFTFCLLWLRLKLNYIYGWGGERHVASSLSKLSKNEYIVLNDVLYRFNEHSTQIDHIVLSVYGIFVIETKSMQGLIFGDADSEYWSQHLGRKRHSFYSPVRQNINHIKFLANKFPELREWYNKVHSIIVFTCADKLRVRDCDGQVMFLNQLRKYIQSFNQVVIPQTEIEELAQLLSTGNISDKKERNKHIEAVRLTISRRTAKIQNGICPRCGGQIVKRQGHYGSFLGCTNYPRCRFTYKD